MVWYLFCSGDSVEDKGRFDELDSLLYFLDRLVIRTTRWDRGHGGGGGTSLRLNMQLLLSKKSVLSVWNWKITGWETKPLYRICIFLAWHTYLALRQMESVPADLWDWLFSGADVRYVHTEQSQCYISNLALVCHLYMNAINPGSNLSLIVVSVTNRCSCQPYTRIGKKMSWLYMLDRLSQINIQ